MSNMCTKACAHAAAPNAGMIVDQQQLSSSSLEQQQVKQRSQHIYPFPAAFQAAFPAGFLRSLVSSTRLQYAFPATVYFTPFGGFIMLQHSSAALSAAFHVTVFATSSRPP